MFVRNGQALGSVLVRDLPKAARPTKAAKPEPELKPEPAPEPAKAAKATEPAKPAGKEATL